MTSLGGGRSGTGLLALASMLECIETNVVFRENETSGEVAVQKWCHKIEEFFTAIQSTLSDDNKSVLAGSAAAPSRR